MNSLYLLICKPWGKSQSRGAEQSTQFFKFHFVSKSHCDEKNCDGWEIFSRHLQHLSREQRLPSLFTIYFLRTETLLTGKMLLMRTENFRISRSPSWFPFLALFMSVANRRPKCSGTTESNFFKYISVSGKIRYYVNPILVI